MEWFGLTTYGVADPIKDMMRPDYVEPKVQPDAFEIIAKGTKKGFSELITELDCYIGCADGYAYRSYDRLTKMRMKGIFKPVEPNEMYIYPGTNSMNASFWRSDPALKGEDWYKKRIYEPKPSTEISRYLHNAMMIDKFFKL